MPDKTEDEKPQLVSPPIPTGSIYETRRPLSPPIQGRAGADADAAAATAAATSVEPGLQDAILKLLPKWRPLVERVERLEATTGKDELRPLLNRVEALEKALDKGAHYLDAEGAKDVDTLKQRQGELAGRLDGLTAVVAELREELGADEDDDGK